MEKFGCTISTDVEGNFVASREIYPGVQTKVADATEAGAVLGCLRQCVDDAEECLRGVQYWMTRAAKHYYK